ncbi:unnamed protein product [Microthlaspi erraticum]|uniref:F-box domain-containing protein n=1 Tax=Microthlaspi erraticum TaxID=1685480 RepID=A0A6D2HN25_9BRAS|nr:unnamed protein product [Microthlaspi erraticum]
MASPIQGVDFISSMPDVILHHIVSFIPIKLAIITSALSRRWRHVWCGTPCLDFDRYDGAEAINQTLNSYRAQKITSFDLSMSECVPEPQIDSWIEFAMSRNVEKMSLSLSGFVDEETYRFPDSFYLSSSLEELWLDFVMIPGCTVSWKSLRRLTLCETKQSLADILTGCPVLETLELLDCGGVQRLDLTKSPTLTRLTVFLGQFHIIAPHIRYLKLTSTKEQCTLVDVSSLIEASLAICLEANTYGYSSGNYLGAGDYLPLQNMVLKMLAKLQNVKKLTFGSTFLQDANLARCLDSQGLDPNQCWRSKLYEAFPTSADYHYDFSRFSSKLVASFIEMVLKNAKTLETLTVALKHIRYRGAGKCFKELLQMHPTLSNNNNVSIEFRRLVFSSMFYLV